MNQGFRVHLQTPDITEIKTLILVPKPESETDRGNGQEGSNNSKLKKSILQAVQKCPDARPPKS
jgi:hypothetical protein